MASASLLAPGLDFCIEKSYSDAQRFEKDVCHCIEVSLSPGKHWFRNFVLGQRTVGFGFELAQKEAEGNVRLPCLAPR